MSERKIAATPSAYSHPLLIKQLLHTPLMQSPQQEIVYRDVKRLTYADPRDRIGRGSPFRWAARREFMGSFPGRAR
jgi:fatty-acyl-CoA synthase